MTISKNRLQRKFRDRKQEKKFFLTLAVVTLLLILILYLIYS